MDPVDNETHNGHGHLTEFVARWNRIKMIVGDWRGQGYQQ
jgi:hypothetical protein